MHIPFKKTLSLCSLLFLFCSVQGQERIIKSIDKSFPFSQAGKIRIQNEYGHLAIQSWEKDSLMVLVDIKVTHKKKENAQNLMDRVSPIIEASSNYVNIRTEILERSQSFFSKYIIQETPLDFGRGNLEINYTIYLPARASLDIDNKFGDVVLEGWRGNLKALIEHGDVFLGQEIGQIDLNMAYGKIKGRTVNYGSIELKNGSLDLQKMQKLRLKSQGSTVSITSVDELELFSNKDGIDIDSLKSITGELKFTTLEVDKIDASADMEMKISDFTVNKIQKEDASIVLKQEDSEIKLNISGISFTFDALLEEGLIRIPKTFQDIHTMVVDRVRKIREIEATYGKKRNGRISIQGSKGVIILKESK